MAFKDVSDLISRIYNFAGRIKIKDLKWRKYLGLSM
jgi:hypothetical protein